MTVAVIQWTTEKKKLCHHRLSREEDVFFSEKFLIPRPILQAITNHKPTVLLIDEIVKSDSEFEAFLLEVLSDFQISIPERTRSDFYEVWIKYVIRLYDADGALVVEWPLTAYGKASRENFGMLQSSKEPGMRDVTMIALRDAGAFLALRFTEVPEVKQWLARHTPGGDES